MSKLFGIPVDSLAVVLLALAVAALGSRGRARACATASSSASVCATSAGGRGEARSSSSGSMLGTAIITAALATGDTMSQTIRSLGDRRARADRRGRRGEGSDDRSRGRHPRAHGDTLLPGELRRADRGCDSRLRARRRRRARDRRDDRRPGSRRRGRTSRGSRCSRATPRALRPFGEITSDGKTVSLADLGPGEVYPERGGRRRARRRTPATRSASSPGTDFITAPREGDRAATTGGATDDSGLLLPLSRGAAPARQAGAGRRRSSSRTAAARERREAERQVVERMQPTLSPLGLETDKTKQDALNAADQAGAAFMSFFTTFGSFSIAAGILLIFLIFVMLAAERRSELGIARAVGTRRGHLVQMFLFEGVAYDLIAAAVGAAARGRGRLRDGARHGERVRPAFDDFHISYSVKPASLVLAYTIGVLLTLAVVAFSAWRVEPDEHRHRDPRTFPTRPPEQGPRRRWLLGVAGIVLGALLAVSGVSAEDAITLGLGVSLRDPRPRAGAARARACPTGRCTPAPGSRSVSWFVLPISRWLFGDLKRELLDLRPRRADDRDRRDLDDHVQRRRPPRRGRRDAGTDQALAPVLRMSIAYPLRSLFRTGVTLAMFTLVVFTLVVGATTTGSFVTRVQQRAAPSAAASTSARPPRRRAPIVDMPAALRHCARSRSPLTSASSRASRRCRSRRTSSGPPAKPETYLVARRSTARSSRTRPTASPPGRGLRLDAPRSGSALETDRGLAVVDQYVVPRRANCGFGPAHEVPADAASTSRTRPSTPVPVTVRDPQTGKHVHADRDRRPLRHRAPS